jgi:hypothetical protein
MATGDLQARVAVRSGFSHLTSSGPDEMASIDVFSIVAPTEGKVSMTDRTRPRLLAVSQIPPDLRAVLCRSATSSPIMLRWREGPRRDSTSP